MNRSTRSRHAAPMLAAWTLALAGAAHGHPPAAAGGIDAPTSTGVAPAFDIVGTRVSRHGRSVTFRMALSGRAGAEHPAPSGQLAGSRVFSYVWPTTLDSATVGFEPGAGLLALAVTAHPDFDDTPLYDENGDGANDNDGDLWHSHWVVLAPNPACGDGMLAVVDIAEGTSPRLPATWPGLPILIDSPGWTPRFGSDAVEVTVQFADAAIARGLGFDGVTAALQVNADVHAPLLCVVDVFDVASGDLSLPGHIER